MSMLPPQPGASPSPAAPRAMPGTRRAGATVLGGAATVGTLAFVGAPWWAVSIAVVLAIAVPGLILVVQAIVPEESEHKRDLWLAGLRYWDRRSRRPNRDRQ